MLRQQTASARSGRLLRCGLLAVHFLAGMLANWSHDHGTCCPGDEPACAAAQPATSAPTCDDHCCDDHRGRSTGGPVEPRAAGWRSLSAAAPCLACEFLAGAVAIMPWAPDMGDVAAVWHEPAASRPSCRILFPRAFLARGPPA